MSDTRFVRRTVASKSAIKSRPSKRKFASGIHLRRRKAGGWRTFLVTKRSAL